MPVWSRQELLLGTLLSHGLYVHFGCGCWFHCCLSSSACITCLGSLMMPFLFSRWFALCVTLLGVSTCILTTFFTFFQSVFFSSIMKYAILYMLLLHPESLKDILLFLCLLVHSVPLMPSFSSAIFWALILFKWLPCQP